MPLSAGKPVFEAYQIRFPYRSMIIRPGSPGPVRGYPEGVRMKYRGSSAAGCTWLATVIAGGLRSGRLTKCSTPRPSSGVAGATAAPVPSGPVLAAAGRGHAYPPKPARVSPPAPTTAAPLYRIISRRDSP